MNNDYAIADGEICAVTIFPLLIIDYPDVVADPGIHVNYCVSDDTASPYTDIRWAIYLVVALRLGGIIVVRTHYNGVGDLCPGANDAPYPDYGVSDLTLRDDGSLAEDG